MRSDWLKSPADLLGKTADQVLQALELDLRQASRHDEPPGKLRALSFSLAGEEAGGLKTIGVYLKYESHLFSDRRDWEEAAILRTEVIGLRLKWQDRAEDVGAANPMAYH
jgi:hypothetical protein